MQHSRRRLLTPLFAMVMGVLDLLAALLLGLWLAASGKHRVAPTVIDDPSLPSVEVGGVRLHAEVFGDPDAPLFVVVHGGPGGSYRPLLALTELADMYRVLFYDQRGAGRSQRVPDDALTVAAYVDELHQLIEEAGDDGEPVHLLGHSWGTSLVAHYLAAHPERPASLILGEGPYLTSASRQAFRQQMARRRVSGPAVLWHVGWSWLQSLHVRGPDADAPSDFLVMRAVGEAPEAVNPAARFHCSGRTRRRGDDRMGARALWAGRVGVDDDAVEAALRAFRGPVLLLAGSCNEIIGEAFQRRHHLPLLADGELVVIENAGHGFFLDQPRASVDAVRAFLERIESPRNRSGLTSAEALPGAQEAP